MHADQQGMGVFAEALDLDIMLTCHVITWRMTS